MCAIDTQAEPDVSEAHESSAPSRRWNWAHHLMKLSFFCFPFYFNLLFFLSFPFFLLLFLFISFSSSFFLSFFFLSQAGLTKNLGDSLEGYREQCQTGTWPHAVKASLGARAGLLCPRREKWFMLPALGSGSLSPGRGWGEGRSLVRNQGRWSTHNSIFICRGDFLNTLVISLAHKPPLLCRLTIGEWADPTHGAFLL